LPCPVNVDVAVENMKVGPAPRTQLPVCAAELFASYFPAQKYNGFGPARKRQRPPGIV
jgi:hypothetical protein